MQTPLRLRRRISRELRPEAQLEYERLSDPILVMRARGGDPAALSALCERHAPRVERTAHHVLGDTEDARDAAQEALERLCSRVGQYRGEAAFTTWLHRLTVNCCHDLVDRRRARSWEPFEADARMSAEPGPAREAELAELRSELRAALALLPRSQARVVVLKDVLELSYGEIAAGAGMPVGTAKCYAHRARAGLRAILVEDGSVAVAR